MEVGFGKFLGEDNMGVEAKFFMSLAESSVNFTGELEGGDEFIVIR
jgi:hypothetical protein